MFRIFQALFANGRGRMTGGCERRDDRAGGTAALRVVVA